MNSKRIIRNLCLLAVFCLLLAGRVSAQQTGSVQLKNITGDVCIYLVTDETGALTEPFAQTGITVVENAAENARILQKYAADNQISGEEKTPESGVVTYSDLEEGCYLVCSMAPEREFAPFFLWIPTSLEGEKIYDVQATPKTDDTPSPTIPTEPTPPKPNIPQTGNLLWPQYALLGLGFAVMIWGMAEVIRGRRKQDE